MTYKDTLLFIGKCLTTNTEPTHREFVKKTIENNQVDWDMVVKIASEHYVLPAVYINIKGMGSYVSLPLGLFEFLRDIYIRNRERNRSILQEAIEINELLNTHGIQPIFIKGTGLLLDAQFQNNGERMIGDIDLLIDDSKSELAIKLLTDTGYGIEQNNNFKNTEHFSERHYPRMVHNHKVAAVEIHFKAIRDRNTYDFTYFSSNKRKTSYGCNVMSHSHQMFMAIISNYHNDYGYILYTTPLRNVYDVYLLSKKIISLNVLMDSPEFYQKLNFFLGMAHYLTQVKSILYIKSKKNNKFQKRIQNLLDRPNQTNKKTRIIVLLHQLKASFFNYRTSRTWKRF